MADKNTYYSKTAMENLAKEIDDIKNDYTKIISELSSEIDNLHNYWNDDSTGGQVYQTFKTTFSQSIKPNLEEGTTYMNSFEQNVNNQIDTYKNAESKIISQF